MTTSTSRLGRSLLSPCLSLLVLVACGNSTEAVADKPAAAEASAVGSLAPAAAPGGAAPAANAPKGRGAPDNYQPLVDTLAALERCKLEEDGSDLDGECVAFDAFAQVTEDATGAHEKAVRRTLVNLLGDPSDVVRWSAQVRLEGTGWVEDDELVATVLIALGDERHPEVATELARMLDSIDDARLLNETFRSLLEATLGKLAHPNAFDFLMPEAQHCEQHRGCPEVLAAAAKHNPNLRNRAYAARELMALEAVTADACSTVAEVAMTLAKAGPVASDDDSRPLDEAETLIQSLHGASTKGKDCTAVLPGLIDDAVAMANAGTLTDTVFYAVLEIEKREDKASYMPKLESLAAAVKANPKLDAKLREEAARALEDWKD